MKVGSGNQVTKAERAFTTRRSEAKRSYSHFRKLDAIRAVLG